MIFTLRPYQREAVDATLAHFCQHSEPAVIVELTRGCVLVLAHVKELVAQNHAKYITLGLEADIFAAWLKRKQSNGLFSEAEMNRQLKKQKRITPHIVSQTVEFTQTRIRSADLRRHTRL